MLVAFSNDKTHLLFKYETTQEHKKLTSFPGFIKYDLVAACPAILSIAYNLVQRCLQTFNSLNITDEVKTWLDQPLKLLPIPESFSYYTKPKDFQEIALRFLYTLGSAGILLDPGMGKTKVVLDYIALKNFQLSLIVCPAALLFVWEEEIEKHRPDLTYYTLRSTDWEEEKKNFGNARVIILNYNKAVILKHRLKELKTDYIHVDEFLIKDPSTDRTKSILEIARQIPFRSGGSGTLINNSPLDSFSPLRYLQPSMVGWNYGNFMDRYCVMKDFKSGDGGVTRKRPVAYKNQVEIRGMLDSCCIVMTKEKWLKLPEKVFKDIYVQMEPGQKEAYYQLSRNYYTCVQGIDIQVDNPLVMLSKLYQISQGFVYVTKDDYDVVDSELLAEGTKNRKVAARDTLYFPTSPKIAALEKLLTETLLGKKSIIWFNLTAELKLIEDLLLKLGHSYLTIKGGDKKIGDKVKAFNKTPGIQWLVCQAKSVNYGRTSIPSFSKSTFLDPNTVIP